MQLEFREIESSLVVQQKLTTQNMIPPPFDCSSTNSVCLDGTERVKRVTYQASDLWGAQGRSTETEQGEHKIPT